MKANKTNITVAQFHIDAIEKRIGRLQGALEHAKESLADQSVLGVVGCLSGNEIAAKEIASLIESVRAIAQDDYHSSNE